MKKWIIIIFLLSTIPLHAQTQTERISKELSFEKKSAENTLLIANIQGHITVEGYSGNTLMVEVEKIIQAKTQGRLEKGLNEVQLGIIDRADTLILFVNGICPVFEKNKKTVNNDDTNWSYQWQNCKDDTREYDYKLNFRVKVPAQTNLIISTINDGDITAEKVTGKIIAHNINGGINLKDLTQAVKAHTINGDVTIDYTHNPQSECRFYTLNGTINAFFTKGLSSNVSFKTFNGAFYTNLEKLVALPVEVQKNNTAKGIKYTINGNRYQAGSGGALLDFETFNGNVYLKEK